MPTAYDQRLVIIAPAARQAAVNTWIRSNLDPTGGDWLTVALCAVGDATQTVTHYACSAALTRAQAVAIAAKLLQLANVSLPADWSSRTAAGKLAWFKDQAAGLLAGAGLRLLLDPNDGDWSDPEALLGTARLRRVVVPF